MGESEKSTELNLKDIQSTTGSLTNNSVIGRDNGFSGEFHSDGLLRIDGDFKGVVKGRGTVLIGEKGRILGDIYAKAVRVGGKIKGNIFALDRIDILTTGKVLGDIATRRINADEGMIFNGSGRIMNEKELEDIFDQNVKRAAPIIDKDF